MIQLDDKQQAAVELCLDTKKRIVGVTGGPGVGKTTIMAQVHGGLVAAGWLVCLCAPTGKAARRISEATSIPAFTIHKLLEFPRPGEICPKTGKALQPGRPGRNRGNPLEYNCILVDEAPMINEDLYNDLCDAIPNGGIIRMFGDMDQLPPIENGPARAKDYRTPFHRALYTKVGDRFDLVGARLEHNYRQGEGSDIITQCEKIKLGRTPVSGREFKMIQSKTQLQVLERLIQDDKVIVNGKNVYATLNSQIIVPGRKQKFLGTNALNQWLQLQLNPKPVDERLYLERHAWDDPERDFYVAVGDKVILTKNWYVLGQDGIMNGETGIVLDIIGNSDIVVDFGTEIATIPQAVEVEVRNKTEIYNPQLDLDLAYAITTHKCQGSEYDNVIYIIDNKFIFLLYRNNFYTAASRARKHVTVIYHPWSLSKALQKEPQVGIKKAKARSK